MDVEVNVFDQEEIHENCTVIIWRNSITGEDGIASDYQVKEILKAKRGK